MPPLVSRERDSYNHNAHLSKSCEAFSGLQSNPPGTTCHPYEAVGTREMQASHHLCNSRKILERIRVTADGSERVQPETQRRAAVRQHRYASGNCFGNWSIAWCGGKQSHTIIYQQFGLITGSPHGINTVDFATCSGRLGDSGLRVHVEIRG